MSFKIQILIVIAFLPIHYVFSMGRVLAVLPLPYPLEVLEEKLLELQEEDVERVPQGVKLLTIPQYEAQQNVLGYTPGQTFQVPKGLLFRVEFWKLIFAKYSTDQYVIHNMEDLTIYDVVDVSDINSMTNISAGKKEEMIEDRVETRKRKYAGRAGSLSRVRSQLGQSDKLKKGFQYSGCYMPFIEEIFRKYQLPLELTRLPFVESTFNIFARSHAGASGVWQFMKSTGKSYLTINDAVDERNDPLLAGEAAAKLLLYNYRTLESWPLAVTAYNHGTMGVRRISNKMNTKDIVKIVDRYRSSTFGFASKNFYAELLAILEIEKNYKQYFGDLKIEEPIAYDEVKLEKYVSLAALSHHTRVSRDVLLDLNPSLTSKVVRGVKFIPKGFVLHIPKGDKDAFLARLNKMPSQQTFVRQMRNRYHRVRRGDTLVYLARRYRTTIEELKEANRLEDPRSLNIGQVLLIPQ